uniref:Uncharacterized protein n=1 Tax=Anguilla anguilla TaxID=7936 RepID=A0A0E9WL00_ANGAN
MERTACIVSRGVREAFSCQSAYFRHFPFPSMPINALAFIFFLVTPVL